MALMLMCGSAYASEPAAPSAAIVSQKKQVNTTESQQESKNNILAKDKPLPTLKSPPLPTGEITTINKLNNSNPEALRSISSNTAIAAFTFVLAVSTIFLWFETKKAANAAQKSAEVAERSLTDIEGPMLYPEVDDTSLRQISSKTNLSTIAFSIKNYGRTPALPGRIQFSVFVDGDQVSRDSRLLDGMIESQAVSASFVSQPASLADSEDIMAGKKPLIFRGNIIYHDMFGSTYSQEFCMTYDVGYMTCSP